jgi:hypothetical protein
MPPETDEQLRGEVDRLLASGLRAVLAAYREAHVVGSYALRAPSRGSMRAPTCRP